MANTITKVPILKVVLVLIFTNLAVSILMLSQSQITGYELSLYEGTPVVFWVSMIFNVIFGVALVVFGVVKRSYGNEWKLGILIILFTNLLILLLPDIRGYAFSDVSDNMDHIGIIKYIIQTGGSFSVYPVIHVLSVQISYSTGISTVALSNFIGPAFYILFVLYTYILCNRVLPKPAAVMSTLASTVLFAFYYYEVFPMGLAFITYPLFFYMYFVYSQENNSGMGFLIMVFVVFLVFFHPVASFMLMVAIVIIAFGNTMFNRWRRFVRKMPDTTTSEANLKNPMIIFIISFIVFVYWMWMNYPIWHSFITNIVDLISSELLTKPMMSEASDVFSVLGLGAADITVLFVKMFGHVFIYLLISAMAILFILSRIHLRNTATIKVQFLFSYSCFFVFSALLWMIDYVRPITSLNSGRIIWLVISLFPLLVGLGLYLWIIGGIIKKAHIGRIWSILSRFRIGVKCAAVVVIVTCSLIGMFGLYPSPYTYQPNHAVGFKEVYGTYWLLEYGNADTSVVLDKAIGLRKYAVELWGINAPPTPERDPRLDYQFTPNIWMHFSYATRETFGESFESDRYMILNEERLLLMYEKVYPQITGFNKEDLTKIQFDPTVSRIYHNGEMEIGDISGKSSILM